MWRTQGETTGQKTAPHVRPTPCTGGHLNRQARDENVNSSSSSPNSSQSGCIALLKVQRGRKTPHPPQRQTPDISKAKSECELSLWVETQKSSSSLLFSFTFSGSFFCNDFSLLMVPMKFCFQIQNISFNSILNAICRIQRFSYGFLLVYLGTACAVFRLLTITLRRSVI